MCRIQRPLRPASVLSMMMIRKLAPKCQRQHAITFDPNFCSDDGSKIHKTTDTIILHTFDIDIGQQPIRKRDVQLGFTQLL